MSVEITSRRVSDIYLIALAGEVEMSNINEVEPYFDAAFDSGERLLIVDSKG